MESATVVNFLLKELGCSQKELAIRLGVSQAQISKWKKGDHLSSSMEDKMRELLGLQEYVSLETLAQAGSLEMVQHWNCLITYMVGYTKACSETGYDDFPCDDEPTLLLSYVLGNLTEAGATLPECMPAGLMEELRKAEISESGGGGLCFDNSAEVLGHPLANLLFRWFATTMNVYGFYLAYIEEPLSSLYDNFDCYDFEDFEPCLMDLALAKTENVAPFCKDFVPFRIKTLQLYRELLQGLRTKAHIHRIPLKADVSLLLKGTVEGIGLEAEREALGLNDGMLHPDFHMNELIVGMRLIHQVLPAIIKKLGITPEELNIDHESLH